MPVTVHMNHERVEAGSGPSLFDLAEQVGVRVPTTCRKQGKCRECLVEVVEGMDLLTPRSEEERHLRDRFRLSCRCRLAADSGVVRCHTMRRGAMRIEEHALALPESMRVRRLDPAVTREGDTVLLDGQPLVRAPGPLHGLAVDVGTTTVAVRLVDLESGELVARTSFENPQRFGGSDVMARIHFDGANPGRLLQRTLLGYLGHAIEEFPVDPRTIYELVMVGNTTMRDLFFGRDVQPIGQKPYRSTVENEWREGLRPHSALECQGRHLRLPLHPDARVVSLPLVAGHLGADAAACLLASGLAHEDQLVAVMDIGTNTELVLGNRHKLYACSCPAGPAFEGGGVSCGMPALPGAIERVRLPEDGRVEFRVVGDAPPEGLCGSGLVDLLGELLRTGRMNAQGRLEEEPDGVFTVSPEHRVFFREADISELAQAKGATVAGLQILFKRYGVDFAAVDRFYLAGGFARHLDVASSRRIGLIPELPDDRFVVAGNLAIEGATLALLSASRRRELFDLVSRVTHIELETDPHFFEHFVQGCQYHSFAEVDPVHL